ncbi:MucR family transcriptional regulator [Novosphingobium sp. 9U]|uniref:MucR family transcriptional regulator n=1 Tax=Novosphingobium sp. 9U TaxID=2653158 RepID=UPI00135CC4D1|nr:MucR family transcriptional regulator [Novosphingobium sp. 9U]
MTADIISAMVSNNTVPAEQLPSLISSVYGALTGLGHEPEAAAADEKPMPAVTVRKSLADRNAPVSMIDGKSYSSLKRHLAGHGYTPETYRETFGLKSDYPMVAPGYSERRRELAKQIGLGRKAASAPLRKLPRPRRFRRRRCPGQDGRSLN